MMQERTLELTGLENPGEMVSRLSAFSEVEYSDFVDVIQEVVKYHRWGVLFQQRQLNTLLGYTRTRMEQPKCYRRLNDYLKENGVSSSFPVGRGSQPDFLIRGGELLSMAKEICSRLENIELSSDVVQRLCARLGAIKSLIKSLWPEYAKKLLGEYLDALVVKESKRINFLSDLQKDVHSRRLLELRLTCIAKAIRLNSRRIQIEWEALEKNRPARCELVTELEEEFRQIQKDYTQFKDAFYYAAEIQKTLGEWGLDGIPVVQGLIERYQEYTGLSLEEIDQEFGIEISSAFTLPPKSHENRPEILCGNPGRMGQLFEMIRTARLGKDILLRNALPENLHGLRDAVVGHKVFIAGSVRIHEYRDIVSAFWDTHKEFPEVAALLVLVPRHVTWCDAMVRDLNRAGYQPLLLSQLSSFHGDGGRLDLTKRPVIIFDNQGLLFDSYTLANGSFVGGGLYGPVTHNFIEPLCLGVRTWVGGFHWGRPFRYDIFMNSSCGLLQVVERGSELKVMFHQWYEEVKAEKTEVSQREGRQKEFLMVMEGVMREFEDNSQRPPE
jgi:hypothetical protein